MPAPIIEFVDVTVNVAGASADKFSFGTLQGVFAHDITANRQDGPFFSVQEMNDAGFTAGAAAAINAWGTAVFAQDDGVDSLLIGRQDAADGGDFVTTLDAIEADPDADEWYINNIESRVDADVSAVAAWVEARTQIFIPQTSSGALLAGTGGNIGETLKNAEYNRTALIYHATDGEYLDGAWSSSGGGLNLDTPGGVGIWAYRTLEGVPFDPVTGVQATNIYNENANLYGRLKGLNFTSKGTMAAGEPRFIDVTTTMDWTKVRLEEEILGLQVGTPTKIPYTNAGINIVVAAISSVMTRGVNFGHFSPDFPPRIIAPDISQVSAAEKQARTLTVQVEAVLAGAIQKVIINVNLSF